MSNIDIGFITPDYPPYASGGAARSAELIVNELRGQGHDVQVYVPNGPPDENYKTIGRTLFNIGPDLLLSNIKLMISNNGLENHDVVHNYSPQYSPGTLINLKTPVVTTFNNYTWTCINPEYYLSQNLPIYSKDIAYSAARENGYSRIKSIISVIVEQIGKRLCKSSDYITTQTKSVKSILERCGYSDNNIKIIPNILDEDFLIDAKTNPDNQNNILYASRLVEQKGVRNAVSAYRDMPESLKSNWSLNILGRGPLEDWVLLNSTTENNINLGYSAYEKLPDIYRESDIFLHSAKWPEPFSRTWLEALASGTPIISSATPSSREVLQGYAKFYDRRSTSELTSVLQDMIKNDRRRQKLASLGEQYVMDFRPKKIVREYENIYEKVTE